MAKATKSPTYPVELIRNGAALTLTLDRELRPTFTEAVVAPLAHIQAHPASGTASSVADELAKLLKLKDQGVLTQDEFDAQKAKLLAQ